MNKIERVRAALAGAPVDHPPLTLWYHFGLQHADPERTAQAHLEFFDAYDFDWLKVMNDHITALELIRLRDRPDATPGLASIAVPTLVLVGDEDVPTPPADAEFLARQIPGARLEVVARSGHLSNLERPEAFTAALTRFLTS